jgi:hypothetical protein
MLAAIKKITYNSQIYIKMKRLTLLSLIVVIASVTTINAQTIALHTSSGVQIFKGTTTLLTAYNSAQNGDTLYLSGGIFTPPPTFDKQLMIIGAGHYVDSTLATGKTVLNGNITISGNADSFYLEGVEITGTFLFTTNHSVNNVTIKRCKFNNLLNIPGNLTTPSNNLALIGNVFENAVYLNNAQNAVISNCIVQVNIAWSNGNLISNSILMFNSAYAIHDSHNNQINNNIIIGAAPVSGSGNVFNNNLFVAASPLYGSSATTIGNYTGIAQSAIFINQSGFAFNYAHNYKLQNPGTYLGTDGLQVGLYGGTFPYKEGAVPLNPHIQTKTIAPTTDTNGNLQIQIKVSAQNNKL